MQVIPLLLAGDRGARRVRMIEILKGETKIQKEQRVRKSREGKREKGRERGGERKSFPALSKR